MQLLLKLKAKVNAKGDDGQTALHIAAMLGHLDCVKVRQHSRTNLFSSSHECSKVVTSDENRRLAYRSGS